MKVAQLTIEMAANVARLSKDMDAAKRSVDSAMSSIQKSADMAMKALGALGAGLSIAGLTAYLKTVIDLNDTLNDLNKSTGLSVQTLSGLNLAAKQSGSDLAGTAAAINKLQQNIGKNAEQYRMVGVTATNGLEAFKQLSDIFVQIEDPQLRAAFAAEALGKSWQSAAPLLSAGSQSIQDMIDRGTELSRTTPQIAAASDDFNDKLAEMSAAFTGAGNQLLEILLPRLTDLLEIFIDLIRESPLVEGGIKAIGVVFETVAVVGANVGFVIKTLWNELMMLGDIAVAIAKLDFKNVGTIWDESRVAAAKSRAELDDWTASFMKGTTATQRYSQAGDGFNNVLKMLDGSFKKGIQNFIDYSDKGGKTVDVYAQMIQKADELIASLQFETRTLEMDNQERETAIQLRKLETIGIKEGTAEYEKYAQAIMDTVAVNEGIKQRIKLEEEARKQREKAEEEAIKARLKQEEDFAKEVEQINNQIGQSLTDALMQGGMNAKEFLINMFKTMVLRPLLQPIITGVTGALGFGTAGAALAGTGGAEGMSSLSMASGLKSAYDFITSGFTSVGETAAAFSSSLLGYTQATEAAAAAMTVGSDAAVAAALAEMEAIASTSAMIGTAATALAGAAAGVGIGQFISGGKSVIGGNSLYTTGGGAAIGAAIGSIVPGIGTAIGAAIGGILGGVVNAAFGSGAKEYTDSGISGTLKAMGADLQEYQKWKKAGGWFTSTKRGTEFNEINAELKQGIDGALAGITTSVAAFAASLGQPLNAIASFSQEINLSFKNMSNEQIAQAIEQALKLFETSLVDAVIPSITQFARVGEKTAAEVLTRMSTELTSVNRLFDVLGYSLYEASLQGADAASKLVEISGGLEKFTSAVNFYYENFYTAQEKITYQTEQLTKIFGSLNLELPGSNEQFRKLVDAAKAAGDDALFANLLQLAPAFHSLTTAIAQTTQEITRSAQSIAEEQEKLIARIYQSIGDTSKITAMERSAETKAVDESNRALLEHIYAVEDAQAAYNKANQQLADATQMLRESIDAEVKNIETRVANNLEVTLHNLADSFDNLTKNINAQIQTLENQKQVSQQALSNIKSIFDYLGSTIRDILGLMSPTQTAAAGMAFVRQALITARATGYLPDQQQLQSAISAARTGLGGESFGSAFEMRRANLQFANELIQLQEIAGNQEDKAQKQIEAADQQIELLKLQLEQARQQYDDEVVRVRNFYDAQIRIETEQLNAMVATRLGINNLGTGIGGLSNGILGVNGSVLSVGTAVQNLANATSQQQTANAMLFEAQRKAAETAAVSAAAAAKAAAEAAASVKEQTTIQTPFEQSIDQLYREIFGRQADIPGLKYWAGSGKTLAQIQSELYASPEYRRIQIEQLYREILKREADAPGLTYFMASGDSLADIARIMKESPDGKLLGYAAGGYYPGGMALVGEEGPELINFQRPGQVYTASETRDMMAGGADTASEIRQLRMDNQAQSRAMVALQNRMNRLLERWDGDGLPEQRVVTV